MLGGGHSVGVAPLTEGRRFRIVYTLDTPAESEFVEWLRKIGAVPLVLDPAEHDRTVAFTSHLPQLASTALSAALAAANPAPAAAGPGLLDATRLALSPYEIWSDILATNAAEIGPALDAYIARLAELRAVLTDPEMERHFRAGGGICGAIAGAKRDVTVAIGMRTSAPLNPLRWLPA